MADNYTLFSEQIEGLTPNAVEWIGMVLALDPEKPENLEKLKKELSLESDDLEDLNSWPCFEAKTEEDRVWLYSEEGLMDQHLIWFVQALINKFLPPDYVFTASFACTCSKPRLNEFGGYWMAISKNDIEVGNTWEAAIDAADRLQSEVLDQRAKQDKLVVGVFRLQEENPDSAYVRLSPNHELIVHKSDEGIVLDVWKDGEDQDGPVWSTYHFDNEMMPDDEE